MYSSLFPKISKTRQLLNELCVNVICVSETWPYEAHTDVIIRIKEFNVVRSDGKSSTKSRGSGVCIYIKSYIKYKTLSKNNHNENFEYYTYVSNYLYPLKNSDIMCK